MHKLIAAVVICLSGGAAAQDATELVVAKQVLTRMQPFSFQKKREYCGFVGYNAKGVMVATPPVAGDLASCAAPFPRDIAVTASYHTHGDYDDGYFNEVPSIVDIESDREFYMNGYVATPGGRLWYIDTVNMTASQLCGIGCLPMAAAFVAGQSGDIAPRYTYDDLVKKLEE